MEPFFASVLWILSTLKFTVTRAASIGVRWNKRLGEFLPISGLSSYETERQRNALQTHRQESLNFNGHPLNVTYFEDFGFFHFYDNDTRATGVCGDIYTLLSKLLNFTLVLTNSGEERLGVTFPNGTYSGILEYARLNETDVVPKMPVYTTRLKAVRFAPVLWMNSQRLFARGKWKRNYAWMLTLFPMEVWCLIGLFIMTLSVVSFVTERVLTRHRGRQLGSRSYPDHLFYVCSTLCNQVNGTKSIDGGSKILALTISVFCWLTLIGYSSHLIYSMTEENFDAPFDDLETLLKDTNFNIAVVRDSTAHSCFTSPYTYEIFKRVWRAKRVKVLANIEEVYDEVCSNPDKYVLLDSEDAMAARKKTVCRLIPIGSSYFRIPVASGVSRRVVKKKSLDIGFMKLKEFGIIDAIKKRYMNPPRRELIHRLTDSLTIDMGRVSIVFGILFFGIVVSIVICLAENVLFTFKKRKTVESLIQRLPTIRQPVFDSKAESRKRN